MWGATEAGAVIAIVDPDDSQGLDADVKTSADWPWIVFAESQVHCRWAPQGDGSYELQFLVRLVRARACSVLRSPTDL